MKTFVVFMTVLATVAMLVAACTVPGAPFGSATQPASPQQSTGTIEVRVTDAPPSYGDIEEIWVTVDTSEDEGVAVHKAATEEDGEGVWLPISVTGDNPFELLELKEQGVDELLGWATVPTGKYTQIRMTIEKVEVLFEGETEPIEAKLPSGKLKFVRPFDVVDGGTTILLLDFIADKSVNITGKGDVIFKPVVKLAITPPSAEADIGHLYLHEKNPETWEIVEGGAWGKLKYNLSGPTFDFVFNGHGLQPNTEYSLIYYADFEDRFTNWGGNNPGALIAEGASNDEGNIELKGSVELNKDLPHPDDANAYHWNYADEGDPYYTGDGYANAHGAKIWLVPSADYDADLFKVTTWDPSAFLFETDLINYDDTDVP